MNQRVPKTSPSAAIDPELQQFADAIERDYALYRAAADPSLKEARLTAEKVREPWSRGGPLMARVTDHQLPLGQQLLKLRLFEPEPAVNSPVLIYLHGGGWTLFSLDTHDRLMREYAGRTGFKVLGVEYSLAPESGFPVQLDEIAAALDWLRSAAPALGIDPDRLAIGGDSAGANLAIASCLRLRDFGQLEGVSAMLLNYGAFDPGGSKREGWSGRDSHLPLTLAEMTVFWQNYLPNALDHLHPLANPLLADLSGLPPACLVIAECDILLDENLQLAKKLEQAGVNTLAVVYPGATHSFLEAISISTLSERALAESCAWLRATVE